MRSAGASFILLLLAGCTDALFSAEVDADGFAPIQFAGHAFHEVDFRARPDMTLHAEVYLPDGPLLPGAPSRFPSVLVLSPYWGNGTQGQPIGYLPYDRLVRELVPRGYAVVFGDLVGSGGSSGCWDYMGPVEREGAVAMVESIAAQPWSDGQVGMFGISYDGMSQIMAASDAAPHLTTIVPVAPLTHAYAGVIQNGVRYDGTWRAVAAHYEAESLVPPAGGSSFEGWARRLVESPACIAQNHANDLLLDSYSPYFVERDHRPLAPRVNASVFYMQGLRDANVKADNFGAWFEGVPTFKRAWIGNWLHSFPDGGHGGRDDAYAVVHRWFDHELKGVDNGVDREPRFEIEDSTGAWRGADAWPPPDATRLSLALFADGSLAPGAPAPGSVGVGGVSSLPGALPGQPPRGANFTFVAPPEGLHVAGRIELHLTIASDRAGGQVIARLHDGPWRVDQAALDLLYRADLARPTPLTPGEPVEVTLVMYGADYVVAPGRTLRLEILTHDPTSWYEDDVSAAMLTIATDGSSRLVLPILT